MRHNRDEKRFSRTSGHLRCMLANMTNDLISSGAIRTTTPKAKLLRRYAERMITLGKKGTLASRRRAMAFMRSKTAVTKLFADVAPKFMDRNGGYTRILKLGFRPGDCAPMSRIELVEARVEEATPKTAKARARKKPVKKSAAKEAKPKRARKTAKEKEAE
ncbi:MAG TPA: 50S ribosomal protein L17 [Thermodesulfobacteriota bacterium]|nr:50S ribosomal protein L17 [Thermodesulfobacteriota bacterium]